MPYHPESVGNVVLAYQSSTISKLFSGSKPAEMVMAIPDANLAENIHTYLLHLDTGTSGGENILYFGPLWIPAAGSTVKLNMENLPLYRRIIQTYEGNELEVKDGAIFINGEETCEYCFKQDYYFMMGDNRHNSLDSRYWGFVPEDHIVGKPWILWFSSDASKSFPSNIRWKRLFSFI